jgi:hypothetical protein
MKILEAKEWWETDRDVKRVGVAMLFALICGFIVVTFSIDISIDKIRITYAERNAQRWAALLWSGAWVAVGSFIGFIFGIPRSLSSDTARTGAPATVPDNPETEPGLQATLNRRSPSTAVNTNLEQISDWLTKIIVGVSLVNSEQIGKAMLRAGETMASSMGGGPARESLAQAILVYFGVVGLLGGYLLTRLFLQRAFDTAEWSEAGRP